MPFSGKCTFSSGPTLPEIAEDVSDLISINSPHETPLLDALGDSPRSARSTVHEWIEDTLIPNHDTVNDVIDSSTVSVNHPDRFRIGDLIRVEGSSETVLISAINSNDQTITLVRGYGGSVQGSIVSGTTLHLIANAALEGADADPARYTHRNRLSNYTQIFTASVSVSGSELAVNQIGVRDELAWQKNLRSRELLRDLENAVINGLASSIDPQGTGTVRRTLRGIISFLQTNQFVVGQNGFPANPALTEAQLNLALRHVWEKSSSRIDLIVVGGREKRAINSFIASNRRYYNSNESFKDLVSTYESDFGLARVVLSRYVPSGTVLLLDSSRIHVLPLTSRSFHYVSLARTGDSENGQLVGEYTLELRNESAHGIIRGFTA
ncbi:MAG: hypothetical protein KatS3mg104_2594 [Phycisphaerae bacterium]|jgi:hypothetical protein|nr:MAG: hypothetical protein KatS3mg104_2594 [Phycisphaerae bacterium]